MNPKNMLLKKPQTGGASADVCRPLHKVFYPQYFSTKTVVLRLTLAEQALASARKLVDAIAKIKT